MGILDKLGIGKKDEVKESGGKEEKSKKKQDKQSESFTDLSAKVDAQSGSAVKPKKEDKLDSQPSEASQQVSLPGKVSSQSYGVLIKPLLSEKITDLAGVGKYSFAVSRQSNKAQVKKAIEEAYGVSVEQVNIINVSGKQRRYGRTIGRTANWKKAVATLKEGEKIPGFVETVGS